MSEPKTKPNNASVPAFLKAVEHETRRRDALAINEIMTRITGEKPTMWGDSLVGFGSYHYKYASGREGDWPLTAFSPRKSAMSIYIMPGYGEFDDIMARLGKHKTGRACLYINKLEDVDMAVLEELITKSVVWMRNKYGK
jgi:hypothetical protein